MKVKPKVSVIIPTHNRPDLLMEAINSVSVQKPISLEIIIVDDFSTPPVNSKLLCQQFGDNIRVIRHDNARGGAAAKNTGIKSAEGVYVAFLDDDDLYAVDFLHNAVSSLECDEIETLFMGVEWFGENAKNYNQSSAVDKIIKHALGKTINEHLFKFDSELLFEELLSGVPMAFQRPVCLKSHFLDVGLYDEKCLLWDCEWALRACLRGSAGLLNQPLYLQRTSGQSYYSIVDRDIDQSLSILNIKKNLLKQGLDVKLTEMVNKSIVYAGQDLSWKHLNNKEYSLACNDIFDTFHYGVNYSQFKFLLHIFCKWSFGSVIDNKK